jgi:hypothetical protein
VSFGPIVWSIVAALVALVVLALLVLTALRAVGRTTTVLGVFTALVSDRAGMLRARVAALKVRMSRMGGTRDSSDPAPVGSVPTGSASEGVLP